MSQQNDNREIKVVNLSEIHIPDFQRTVDYKRAKRIADNFTMLKFDPPVIYCSGTGYGVIDGNHRITAAKMVGIRSCECSIVQVTDAEAAKLFYTQNENRRAISPYDAFKAKVNANVPESLEVLQAVAKAGYNIRNYTGGEKDICAVSSLERIQKTYSTQAITDVLEIIAGSWPGDEKAKRGDMLQGVALFINICGKQGLMNKREIIRKFSIVPVAQILQSAGARTIGNSGRHIVIAEVLKEVYNKSRKGSARLE